MSTSEMTSLTIRLPHNLRRKIKAAAAGDGRTESNWVRHQLGRIAAAAPVIPFPQRPIR